MKLTHLLLVTLSLTVSSLSQSGKPEASDLKKYEEQLAADPKDESALYNAGLTTFLLGDFPKAVGYFERLCKLNPTDWKTQAKLIQALSAAGRIKERDERIESLKSEWKSGKHPELSEKKFFIRDQFVVDGSEIFVLEYYQLEGERGLVWKFRATKDGEDGDLTVSLGSYRMINETAHSLGEIGPDERLYHLDGYTADGGHMTYGMFKKRPTYESIKEKSILAFKGKLKVESSFQPGKPEAVPKIETKGK